MKRAVYFHGLTGGDTTHRFAYLLRVSPPLYTRSWSRRNASGKLDL